MIKQFITMTSIVKSGALIGLSGLSLLCATATAQNSVDEINKYREMIADGNPADLYEASGEELWKKPAGPKKASLEQCDLGLGAGVIKGASARLPKYFADTKRVQDLESRLMTCMEELQGIDPKEFIDGKFLKGKMNDMAAIVTYIVAQSKGEKINVSINHPEEKKFYELGKNAFFYRGGPMDFSCATCHGSEGKRIRLQELPYIPSPDGAALGWGSWPAYRVSNGQMWTMQHRINDCFRQQRMPYPIYASDVTIALSVYMAATASRAKEAIIKTPGLKR